MGELQVLGIGSHEADPGKRRVAPRKPPEEPVDEQGRLDADGRGAICATKLPSTFRAQRERSAMRGGPKQLAGEIASGRAREGSAPGGVGCFTNLMCFFYPVDLGHPEKKHRGTRDFLF